MGNQIFYPSFDGKREGAMTPIEIPCEAGEISDGYHSFDELYEHRCLLFCVLLTIAGDEEQRRMGWDISSWKSRQHHDGSKIDGWFIAGINFHGHAKDITYHLPDRMWDYLGNVPELEQAPEWDGHTSQDVIERLKQWLGV